MRFLPYWLVLACCVLVPAWGAAQQAPVDTVHAIDTMNAARSPVTDSLHVPMPADTSDDGDIDSIVTYQATDTILYRAASRTMRLKGKAEARHAGQKLDAEIMEIDFVKSVLTAEGKTDSSGNSSLGTPVFDDHGEQYKGNVLAYNFKTKRGNILMSSTKMDNGYYYADRVFRETEKIYFIQNGRYTTCDEPHPHFYFASPKMKVVLQEQVFAAPVYLYIADVPLFALPFGVFPNHTGRSSGLIAPAYGQSSSRGFFLQHLGYYWATNDYMDLALTSDLYTKGSAVFNANLNYALRYNFGGGIAASFARTRMNPDDEISTQWSFALRHSQTIDPRTSLNANLHFVSSSYVQSTATNLSDLLQRTMQSDASFSTSWDMASLSAQYSRSQDLQTNHIFESPSLNFNVQQFYPFRSSRTVQGSESWYELFGMAYSGSVRASHDVRNDSIHSDDFKGAVVHSPSISFTPKFGDFSVSPFFNYSEVWYPERVEQSQGADSTTVIDHTIKGFNRAAWYGMGIAVSTRLYGIMQPRILGLNAIRHTLTPSVTFNYSPDFSDPKYGYYGTYRDLRTGRDVRYSYFAREIAGGPGAGKVQSLGLSLGNTFDVKVADTDTSESRVQVLNATLGASYNMAADSFRLSDIGLSARTNILGVLDLSAGASFSAYHYDTTEQRRVNVFKWNAADGLLDLTSFNFSAGTNFTLMQGQSTKRDSTAHRVLQETDDADWWRFLGEESEGPVTMRMPLSVGLSYSFSQSQPVPGTISRASSMSANLRLQVTPTWSISAAGYYDFVTHALNAPSINIHKDLHCWEMNFVWYPTNQYLQGFSLEIRVKAPQLQDIKLTKRDNVNGLF